MQLSKTLLAATSIVISTVQAGMITCINGQQDGGRGNIPVHNVEFSFDDNGSAVYFGNAFATDCGEMAGSTPDPDSKFTGKGGLSMMAKFWITSDTCMNIMTGGTHYWCCPGSIKQQPGDATTCHFT